MDEIEPTDPEYIKGFNEGYMMQKHLPDIADSLVEQIGPSIRSNGFKDGRQELILERQRERYPKWLRSDRLSSPDEMEAKQKDINKTKDKDDLEPEPER